MRFVVAILQPRLPLLKPWNLNQLTNIINFLSYSVTIFLHLSAKNKLAFPYTRGPVRIRGRDLIGDWKLYGTKRYGNAIQSSLNWKPSTKCGRTQWRDVMRLWRQSCQHQHSAWRMSPRGGVKTTMLREVYVNKYQSPLKRSGRKEDYLTRSGECQVGRQSIALSQQMENMRWPSNHLEKQSRNQMRSLHTCLNI